MTPVSGGQDLGHLVKMYTILYIFSSLLLFKFHEFVKFTAHCAGFYLISGGLK